MKLLKTLVETNPLFEKHLIEVKDAKILYVIEYKEDGTKKKSFFLEKEGHLISLLQEIEEFCERIMERTDESSV
jgi:hypothetical protein